MSFTFCQKLAVVQPSHGLKNNGQVVKNLRNNVSYSSKTPGILVSTQLLFCLPFPDSLSSCHKSKKSIYGK